MYVWLKERFLALREMSDAMSRRRFYRLRAQRRDVRAGRCEPVGEPVPLRLRILGGVPFHVRPGTSDTDVLWEALLRRRGALPPPEVVSPRVIVDLGANVGATMVLHASLFPNVVRIVGVEADSENARLCRANIRPWGDVATLVQGAVWPEDGETSFAVDPGLEWGGHVNPNGDGAEVRTVSMQTLMADQRIDWIDYLKVDIEGSERELFQRNTDWAKRVGVLKVEIHRGYPLDDAIRDLSALGFRVRHVNAAATTSKPVLVASRV